MQSEHTLGSQAPSYKFEIQLCLRLHFLCDKYNYHKGYYHES